MNDGLKIVRRPPGDAGQWDEGMLPLLRRIYAARGVRCTEQAQPKLAQLHPPDLLGGMHAAVQLLAAAIAADRARGGAVAVEIADDEDAGITCDGIGQQSARGADVGQPLGRVQAGQPRTRGVEIVRVASGVDPAQQRRHVIGPPVSDAHLAAADRRRGPQAGVSHAAPRQRRSRCQRRRCRRRPDSSSIVSASRPPPATAASAGASHACWSSRRSRIAVRS